LRLIGELAAQPVEHLADLEVDNFGMDRAGLDLVDVEQHVEDP